MNCRLEAKNCLDGMQALAAESVDVVVTSPPYNLGVDYGTYKDDLPEDQYLRWSRQWIAEVFRLLKAKGSFFLDKMAAALSMCWKNGNTNVRTTSRLGFGNGGGSWVD
jgi:site-specific DNA-methyltransferase (adenine-specific)